MDGIKIFPKHPAQLRVYHKKWQFNQKVKAAMKDKSKPLAELTAMLSANERALVSHMPHPNMPQPLNASFAVPVSMAAAEPLQESAQQPVPVSRDCHFHLVGKMAFGRPAAVDGATKRKHGNRGGDFQPRQPRRCALCSKYGGPYPLTCPGRNTRAKCEHFHIDGSEK